MPVTSFWASRENYEKLKQLGEETNQSRSQIINDLINGTLKENPRETMNATMIQKEKPSQMEQGKLTMESTLEKRRINT